MFKYADCEILNIFNSQEGRKLSHTVGYENLFTPRSNKTYAIMRAISSRVNGNADGWLGSELKGEFQGREAGNPEYGYATFTNPEGSYFIDHINSDRRLARGRILISKLHEDDFKESDYPLDPIQKMTGKDIWVELLVEIDKDHYPITAHAIESNILTKVSMGADVHASSCSICGNVAVYGDSGMGYNDYCDHINYYKGSHVGGKLAYENNFGIQFFEISSIASGVQADSSALSKALALSV